MLTAKELEKLVRALSDDVHSFVLEVREDSEAAGRLATEIEAFLQRVA